MDRNIPFPMQIFIALAAGIATGLLCHTIGAEAFATLCLKPVGDIFIALLKFVVVPIVLLSMIGGVLSMGDLKTVGAVGLRAAVYFLCTTTVACVIGLSFASLFRAAGFFPALALDTGTSWEPSASPDLLDTLTGIFPSNLWEPLLEADMLQIIVIALLLGSAIMAAGDAGRPCRELAVSAYEVFSRLMGFIIRLSPLGVFAMMAWVVAVQGPQIMGPLAMVLLCAYLAYGLHGALVYGLSVRLLAGLSPVRFFRGAFAAMALAFTSTSSAAALPVSRKCAGELGADAGVCAFVLPLGATIHMDGTAIYQCVAAVFLAACAGVELTLGQMVIIISTTILASVGTAGTPGAGTVMLAMTLTALGIDAEAIIILYGVDRLFDMGRTCLNVTGDIACALCISRRSPHDRAP